MHQNSRDSKIIKAQELEQTINNAFIPVKFHYSRLQDMEIWKYKMIILQKSKTYELIHLTQTLSSSVLGGGWMFIERYLRQGFCGRISGSHSCVAEDSSLQGCGTGWLGEWFLMFQSKLFLHLHGSSSSIQISFWTAWSWRSRHYNPMKQWEPFSQQQSYLPEWLKNEGSCNYCYGTPIRLCLMSDKKQHC